MGNSWCSQSTDSSAVTKTVAAIASCYFLMGGLALVLFVRQSCCHLQSAQRLRQTFLSNRSVLLALVGTCALARAVQLTLLTTLFKLFSGHRAAVLIIESIPSTLYVSLELLLIFFWAEIYHASASASPAPSNPSSRALLEPSSSSETINTTRSRLSHKDSPTHRILWLLFVFLNILIWTVTIGFDGVLAGLDWDTTESASWTPLETSVMVWGLTMFLFCGVGFMIYGGCLFAKLKKIPIKSTRRSQTLRWVGTVTVICTLCFALRSLLVIAEVFCIYLSNAFWLYIIYYGILELLPVSLIIVTVYALGSNASSSSPPSIPSSVAPGVLGTRQPFQYKTFGAEDSIQPSGSGSGRFAAGALMGSNYGAAPSYPSPYFNNSTSSYAILERSSPSIVGVTHQSNYNSTKDMGNRYEDQTFTTDEEEGDIESDISFN